MTGYKVNRPRLDPNPAPKQGTGPARVSRQRRERLNRDAEYNVTSDIFKEQNPECFYCGKKYEPEAPQGLQTDHIVSGTAGRAATLLNAETWNNGCPDCNQAHFPIEVKVLAKVNHVIKTIENKRGRKFSDEQWAYVLGGLVR